MAWWQVLHILSCIACWLLCAGSSRPESGRGHFLIPQPHLHSIVCCHLSDCHCKFKNGIVKCICDGSLDSHIFPAFSFPYNVSWMCQESGVISGPLRGVSAWNSSIFAFPMSFYSHTWKSRFPLLSVTWKTASFLKENKSDGCFYL